MTGSYLSSGSLTDWQSVVRVEKSRATACAYQPGPEALGPQRPTTLSNVPLLSCDDREEQRLRLYDMQSLSFWFLLAVWTASRRLYSSLSRRSLGCEVAGLAFDLAQCRVVAVVGRAGDADCVLDPLHLDRANVWLALKRAIKLILLFDILADDCTSGED
jgi:hypothetical protein